MDYESASTTMPGGPTIYDIARRAGVGIATVSRVMNGSSRVTAATRDAVKRAMDDLGFRPNRAARRLAARGPNRPRVAALMPFFSGSFYVAVSRPLAQALAAADIDLVLHDVKSRDDKNRILDRIVAERSCEALALCSMGIGAERQEQFARLGVPMVSVDYPLAGVASITVDNADGMRQALDHLRGSGARRIGFISGLPHALAFREREATFTALAGADAPLTRAESMTREDGRAAAVRLLELSPGLDAIVCANDLFALGALEELRARGVDVPGRMQVIGFDDQPLMDFIGLSTVRQPMHALGEWAAARLGEALAGARLGDEASRRLPVAFVARATTRPAITSSSTTRAAAGGQPIARRRRAAKESA